ncbi:hypothetical protein [Meiothermus granaticius]|uniref:DNA polymerase III subunit tau n=1 Tax=Meiothermus granaticius NBRC 107808 TaxID=1227551 RepID=A0A399FBL4_9DEIN|nr:hypothetical protein [Meiothermus granaticius]RIH92312.1 DNA polymerase III subunit tau [Meiothermus granaticius NBRC 107808]GEM88050.1 DNA polymerase III subunit delta' [Meiothermus granaticius NBRC 107808]
MTILGHQRILELLPRLNAQTLLFTGPEGVGRRAVAQWFARGLNCSQGFPPCGHCEACRQTPPADYREIAPDLETKGGKRARAPQIRLEQIAPREGEEGENLLDWISTYPRYRVKVATIDGAHLLNESAANALLKVLEEPPAYTRLILIAPGRETVLPTLVSRSLEVAFAPLPEALLRTLSPDPEVLGFAEGSVGKARWALEHPAEFAQLTGRAEGVLEALRTGPAPTLEALRLLLELEGGLSYLSRRLRQAWDPESPRYRQALQSLAEAQDALEGYVSEDLVQTLLALRLTRLSP